MKDLALSKATNLIELLNIEVQPCLHSLKSNATLVKKISDRSRPSCSANISLRYSICVIRSVSWRSNSREAAQPRNPKKTAVAVRMFQWDRLRFHVPAVWNHSTTRKSDQLIRNTLKTIQTNQVTKTNSHRLIPFAIRYSEITCWRWSSGNTILLFSLRGLSRRSMRSWGIWSMRLKRVVRIFRRLLRKGRRGRRVMRLLRWGRLLRSSRRLSILGEHMPSS